MAILSARTWEKYYPSAVSAFAVVATSVFLWRNPGWIHPMAEGVKTLSPSALNVGAIAVGFLATSQSLLLSLANTPPLKALKDADHYERLLKFFSNALTASFATAILSGIVSTIHLERSGGWRFLIAAVWMFGSVCAILCYVRISRLMNVILRLRDQPQVHPKIPSDSLKSLPSSEDEIELLP
jgi:MFS family permease